MRSIQEIKLLNNVPVLLRGALNTPIKNGLVANDFRLRRALPTLRFLTKRGARVVIASHLGDSGTETLESTASALKRLIRGVTFFPECVGARAREAVRRMRPGEIMVLENLRRHRGEKFNDPAFAHELAELADVFVQDSFDTCHRNHASIVGVSKLLPSYAGLGLEEEVRELSRGRKPVSPSLAIIGGAKFSTKEAVLTKLLETYTYVVVGGALANDFLATAGQEVGKSLVSHTNENAMKTLLTNPKLIGPLDLLVISESGLGKKDAQNEARIVSTREVLPQDVIVDCGPSTIALVSELAHNAKTILWNGPLGIYEEGFTGATDALAQIIANTNAHSIVGGGDTVTAIERLGLLPQFTFVSTGGGAMLDFLANGTLPGIAVLENQFST